MAIGLVFVYDQYFDTPEQSILKSKIKAESIRNDALTKFTRGMSEKIAFLENKDKNVYKVLTGVDSTSYLDEDVIYTPIEDLNGLLDGEPEILRTEINSRLLQIADLKERMQNLEGSYSLYLQLKGYKEKRLQSIPYITPIGKDSKYRVASGFGKRRHPVFGIWKMHTGLDYACKKGTPIRATGDGIVKRVGKSCCKGYGNYVDLDHGFGFRTKYGHMSKVLVKRGQKVKRGDIIGEVGSTGTSTGNHLHYEVIKNGQKINPVQFVQDLSKEEYAEMLKLASESNEAFSIPEED
tara:strand:- start:802 stop:1683 length:882 start_codon:yes stop_codon:yes gene_type:complete